MNAAGPVDLDPQVQAALVGLASAFLVALLGGLVTITTLLIQTKGHAKRADAQVSNDHVHPDGSPINLRVEADERHAETMGAIEALAGTVRGVQRDVGRVDQRTIDLRQDLSRLDGRVVVVETTQQREEIQRVRDELRAQARRRHRAGDEHGVHPYADHRRP